MGGAVFQISAHMLAGQAFISLLGDHCKHPTMKRRCLGLGGTKEEADIDSSFGGDERTFGGHGRQSCIHMIPRAEVFP